LSSTRTESAAGLEPAAYRRSVQLSFTQTNSSRRTPDGALGRRATADGLFFGGAGLRTPALMARGTGFASCRLRTQSRQRLAACKDGADLRLRAASGRLGSSVCIKSKCPVNFTRACPSCCEDGFRSALFFLTRSYKRLNDDPGSHMVARTGIEPASETPSPGYDRGPRRTTSLT